MRTFRFTVLISSDNPVSSSVPDEDGSFDEEYLIIQTDVIRQGETLDVAQASLVSEPPAWPDELQVPEGATFTVFDVREIFSANDE